MTERKGRTTKKATAKKSRPDCTPRLQIQIDAVVNARLPQLGLTAGDNALPVARAGLIGGTKGNQRKLSKLLRNSSRRFAEDMLNHPDVKGAFKEVIAAKVREITVEVPPEVAADYRANPPRPSTPWTPEQVTEVGRRIEETLLNRYREDFLRRRRKNVEEIAKTFSIRLTDEQAVEVLKAAWDPRCEDWWMDVRGSAIEKDREYLRWAERHYNGLLTILLDDPHLPCAYWAAVETAVVLGVLAALKAKNEKFSRWKKREKFAATKTKPNSDPFWNEVIGRLVDAVRPFFHNRKGMGKEAVTPASFFVSKLLKACYPKIWKDATAEMIRLRYTRQRDNAVSRQLKAERAKPVRS